MANILTFVCNIDYDDMEDGEVLWTQPHKFDYPGAHEVQGGVRKGKDKLKVILVLSSDPQDKRLSWPVSLKWKLFIVKNNDPQLNGTQEMTCNKENVSRESKSINLSPINLLKGVADDSIKLMWLVEITLSDSYSMAPVINTRESLGREILDYLQPDNKRSVPNNLQYVCEKIQEYESIWKSSLDSDNEEVGQVSNVSTETKMADSLTFMCNFDYDDMEDGEVLWTQPYKFDYPGAHEVQGGVRKEKDKLKVTLVLSSDLRNKGLSWPVHLKWKVFTVKNKDMQLKDTRERDCRLEDLSKDSDWRQGINIQFPDLIRDNVVDASDVSVTIMWAVEITIFQRPTKKTRQSAIIAREIVRYLSPANIKTLRQNVQHVGDKLQEHDASPFSLHSDDTKELGATFMAENMEDKLSSPAETKMADSLTFMCNFDYDDMEDGEVLWTQLYKFDYPGAHEVQGGVRKEQNGLKVNLVLSSDPRENKLTWPVHLKWKVFTVKNKDRQLKDTREIDCRLEDLSKDSDWRQGIDIQFLDLKTDNIVDASDGSLTLMWFVEIANFQSPIRQTRQKENIAREIRHRPTENFKENDQEFEVPKPGTRSLSLDSDETEELREKPMDENVAGRSRWGSRAGYVRHISLDSPFKIERPWHFMASRRSLRAPTMFSDAKKIDIDMLLLGKTGSGKSSTGNSILMRKIFKSSYESPPRVTEVKTEWSKYTDEDNRSYYLKVTDCPGLEDTSLNKMQDKKRAYTNIAKVLSERPEGIHVFLLVVRMGTRFTDEDTKALESLKEILGNDYMRQFGIVIITGGDDLYDYEDEGTRKTFHDWCREQEGELRQVMQECVNRCVLFDNRTKDKGKKKEQLETLLEVALEIISKNNGERYTNETFKKVAISHKQLLNECSLTKIR